MDEHISDYRLLSYYKSIIKQQQYDTKLLNSQFHCCESSIKLPMYGDIGVFLMTNDVESKIWGTTTCKNPWACPVCSARKMSEYAQNIACAIDALYKWKHKVPFMITFSIPHTARYTCKQTYEILQKTWLRFYHLGNKKHCRDPFSNFCEEFGCVYRVRVTEFTWGENGWHPHYHCLFWVDEDKLQDVIKYQKKLYDKWISIAHTMTKRVLMRDFIPSTLPPWDTRQHAIQWIDNFYGKKMRKSQAESFAAAHISVDAQGKVVRAKTSQYICGWGADKELTGNIRKQASHSNHYTPYQILCKAFDAYKKGDHVTEKKFANLYLEYARTTSGKRRINFSPGVSKIIGAWKKTQEYSATYKKKVTENQDMARTWRIVVWFKSEQWSDIYYLNQLNDGQVIDDILALAKLPDGRRRTIEYLQNYGVDISYNLESIFAKDILNIFNVA